MGTKIHNSDLTKALVEGAKIQVSFDKVPNEIAEKVVPVMEVNPRFLRTINVVRRATATNATAATIFTTPSDRDFFLVGAQISHVRDATATSVRSDINGTIDGDGTVREILSIATITLNPAAPTTASIALPIPIKMARNTTIALANSTNVANVVTTGVIYGYIVENVNA